MADTTESANSNGWLDRLFNTGLSAFTAYTAADNASAAAQANVQAQQAAAAQAQATSKTTLWLIVGGGVALVLAVVLFARR